MAEHLDVLIVGAGLSGVGAAWRLSREHPERSYAVLEGRAALGGTWDLFRYPGVRSDSDMFTMSYPFRPWRSDRSLADGESIRTYIREIVEDGGIGPRIRFDTKVTRAAWSSEAARWTVETSNGTYTCKFLYCCSGYYDYDSGYEPDFKNKADFTGTFVHPQFWPADLDTRGKRIVVIGSGATAVTLVPTLAPTAEHVTMLQRSPTYLTVLPGRDKMAAALMRRLPAGAAHRLVRARNVAMQQGFYQLARRRPERVKALLRRFAVGRLGDEAYVDKHFKPTYQPWDQRLCVIPDGDLYNAIREGKASVATDTIQEFVPEGIRLGSGEVLEADIVVSATGLSLLPLGGIALEKDGAPLNPRDMVAYRTMMLSGVPNLAFCIGYTNASWTLRADLSHRYVMRLLTFMDRNGYATATPDAEPPGPRRPLLDFTSGYVQRALHLFMQQGERDPWTVKQNYIYDLVRSPRADLRRGMTFTRKRARVGAAA
ncbi:NAD(P)/FAD-dependent oxidoreductase [Actinoplanes sp. NBRC 103695]|uniref:flavin-containing monooxygenase n=1 Tax=Actinoplanes sp. NBRC 103695 TaxID=3032202 RepID=UPI0024A021BB|nr:NAD(P)/FAD-dependent oxidoreductase [Actinoplanes sp. NBRC 103695]GLY92993.1 monooxygenase flavin-binding family protein [Actinoplanes sp. NBRC 103695]